jgi:DNA-binding MarR family transcriptional regulator
MMTDTMEILRSLYLSDKAGDDIGGGDLAVLTYLLLRAAASDNKRGFFEAKGTIAKRLGISLDTLARSLKRLMSDGYVTVKSRGSLPALFILKPDRLQAT